MAKTLATQRSLKYLRTLGWQCGIVEHWNAHIGIRQDLWHFADILACKPDTHSFALVQTFPLARWKDHRKKLEAINEARVWQRTGGIVLLHGWAFKPKDGIRGAKKVWQLREESL